MFRRLTVPLLRPILAMVVILTVIGSFQVFDIVAGHHPGRPGERLERAADVHLQTRPSRQFDFGYAATMSLALFAMLIAITFLQMRLARANESDLS